MQTLITNKKMIIVDNSRNIKILLQTVRTYQLQVKLYSIQQSNQLNHKEK